MTEQALYKSLERPNLRGSELEEVMLAVEINMNNRPLTYRGHPVSNFNTK